MRPSVRTVVKPTQRDRLESLLMSSPVLGCEIDIRYRVLAITLDVPADQHPVADVVDPRVQLVVHPVGVIAARLLRHGEPPTVMRFDETQLGDVVGSFAGAMSTVDPLPASLPDFDSMADGLSMSGAANTGDGTAANLHLRLVDPDDLTLDLWASFDVAELRDPDGNLL